MSTHNWAVNLDSKQYNVKLDRNYWSARQIITGNGQVKVDKTPFNNLQNDHYFQIDDHKCCVTVGRRYFTFSVKRVVLVYIVIICLVNMFKIHINLA